MSDFIAELRTVERATDAMFDVAGRVALVTGASSGLGRHFARTLGAAGARVTLCGRRQDKLEEVAEEIAAAGGHAFAIAADVTERASVHSAFDVVTQRVGVPTIVLNNAGVADTKPALAYDDPQWQAIVGTNLTGAWIVAQEAAKCMAGAGLEGTIINVSSILARRVAGGVCAYAASKAALSHLTRALALEWARHGIRVNSLAPGYIATELNREFLGSDQGERLRSRNPMRRFGNCSDLDGCLLLLASGASDYITGAEIVVDGGHLCSSL